MTLMPYCGPRWHWHLTVVQVDFNTLLWSEMTLTPHCSPRWGWLLAAVRDDANPLQCVWPGRGGGVQSGPKWRLYFTMCSTCFAERSTMTLTPYSVFDLFCREVHDNIDTLQCVWPVLQRGPRWHWHLTMCLTCFAERSTMTLTTWSMFGLFCSEVQDDRDPLPSDLAVWRGGESQVLPVPLPAVPMQAGDPARTATADGGLQHPERHQGPGQHRLLLGRSVHDRFPVNIPDPVRIGWEALVRSGPDDSCTPASFRAGSVWPKPDTVSQN